MRHGDSWEGFQVSAGGLEYQHASDNPIILKQILRVLWPRHHPLVSAEGAGDRNLLAKAGFPVALPVPPLLRGGREASRYLDEQCDQHLAVVEELHRQCEEVRPRNRGGWWLGGRSRGANAFVIARRCTM